MIKLLQQMFGDRNDRNKTVIIVSGLPRSGTSMMMKILEAGGMSPLIDHIRTADSDNPKGYYEFERVKKLPKGDVAWLEEAQGKVVKVIAILLLHLPATYNYRIIFMRRAMPEILASQRKMLINRGEDPNQISDEDLSRLFESHVQKVNTWLNSQPNVKWIEIHYNELIENPEPHLVQINRFLGNRLNVEEMAQVIDPNLYRQRKQHA